METKSMKKNLKLKTSWDLYDHEKKENHDYDEGKRFIGSFSDIEGFWSIFNNLPKPSNLFYQKDNGKPYFVIEDGPDGNPLKTREIASMSLFRKDIKPEWEDPHNKNGGIISLRKFFKKGMSPIDYLDTLLINLIMLCIGESFKYSDNVTGIRVVDSSLINAGKPLYRLELWINDKNLANDIQDEFKKVLDLNINDRVIYKSNNE